MTKRSEGRDMILVASVLVDVPERRWRRRWFAIAAGFVVVGAIAAALAAASVANVEVEQSRRVFEQNSTKVALTLQMALSREQDLAIATGAFLLSKPDATNGEFLDWLQSVRTTERYPELLGMGEVVVVAAADLDAFVAALSPAILPPGTPFELIPAGRRPTYCLIRVNLPSTPNTTPPAGFDFCANSTGALFNEARDSGAPSYQVVNTGTTDILAVSAPFYRGGVVPITLDARREAFAGLVGMSVDPEVVLHTALQNSSDMAVAMAHHGLAVDAVEFQSGQVPSGALSRTIDLHNGWTVQVFTPPIPTAIFAYGSSTAVLIAGVAASVLLAALVLVLGTTRARAIQLVAERTGQLRHQSLHDALTGLPNRALIADRLDQLLARSRRHGTTCSALFLDLDDFKNVNDTLGHQVGDSLLVAVADRLASALRDVDTIGRMGGDEFVVLIDGGPVPVAPQLVAERLLDVMRQPFELEDTTVQLTVNVSIGIAIGEFESGIDLLRNADVALYQAKAAGKNRYEVYRPEMQSTVNRQIELEIGLRSAIECGQFRLAYQPIYNLDDVSLVGVEALLRWDHPTLGSVEPEEFIPILERNSGIIEVGRWVLTTACEQMARWHALGDTLDISVNVSARQLDTDDVIDHIRSALRNSHLDAGSLIIEVTETALMGHVGTTAARLAAIKQLGVRVAVDDFGTGYSSLAYLQQFPVDCIKIDRRFTNAISSSPESKALISTLVQLGRDLGLQTLAEGVETSEQMDHLRDQRVDCAQGFLLSLPLDPDTLETQVLVPHRTLVGHQGSGPSSLP